MESADDKAKVINASPTKAFFIHMLTRDVPLSRAILDLVDNCVDGARRECGDGPYNELWIRIDISEEMFRIADNCGGIPIEIAREHAFRFGRPSDALETVGSIGQFGVGMKRSFFKLGKEFLVKSQSKSDRFLLDVKVDEWMAQPDEELTGAWHFRLNEVGEGLTNVPKEEIGTIIEIRQLRESFGETFELENFKTRLSNEISAAHSISIERGLSITLNGIPVEHTLHLLLQSDVLKPAFIERVYPRTILDGEDSPPVKVRLYAGIAERKIQDGGWYIFCNGRLVLKADKSSDTVWGASHNMRQYHAELAYFRGFAFFDCDHAALLPWTTTKTGVDTDSKLYGIVQQEMIEISRPVIEFLSRLEKERVDRLAGNADDEPLLNAINAATEVRAEQVVEVKQFVSPPAPVRPSGPQMSRIQYSKRTDLVNKAKRLLGVSTFTAVGEKTFEYFLRNEGEE
jgi:hypothetical protein